MKRYLTIGIGFVGAVALLAWVGLRESQSRSHDFLPLGHILSGPAARLVVIQRDDPVQKELLKGSSVTAAYAKDPKPFEANFALLHTYGNALLVAKEANSSHLPLSSERLALVLKETAVDHWGRPFCVTGNTETLLVISSGETQKPINCGGTVKTRTWRGFHEVD